jgi:hypothetical protein
MPYVLLVSIIYKLFNLRPVCEPVDQELAITADQHRPALDTENSVQTLELLKTETIDPQSRSVIPVKLLDDLAAQWRGDG